MAFKYNIQASKKNFKIEVGFVLMNKKDVVNLLTLKRLETKSTKKFLASSNSQSATTVQKNIIS